MLFSIYIYIYIYLNLHLYLHMFLYIYIFAKDDSWNQGYKQGKSAGRNVHAFGCFSVYQTLYGMATCFKIRWPHSTPFRWWLFSKVIIPWRDHDTFSRAKDVSVSDRTMMGCRIDLMVTRKDDQVKPNYFAYGLFNYQILLNKMHVWVSSTNSDPYFGSFWPIKWKVNQNPKPRSVGLYQ